MSVQVILTGKQSSSVVANPTLVGTESDLTGLEVENIKYKISSLPAVTSSDNGKVLMVSDGAWTVSATLPAYDGSVT